MPKTQHHLITNHSTFYLLSNFCSMANFELYIVLLCYLRYFLEVDLHLLSSELADTNVNLYCFGMSYQLANFKRKKNHLQSIHIMHLYLYRCSIRVILADYMVEVVFNLGINLQPMIEIDCCQMCYYLKVLMVIDFLNLE